MNTDRIRFFAYVTVTSLGAIIGCYVFFKCLFAAIFPFLVALTLAFLVDRPARFLSGRTHIPVRILRLILTVASTLLSLGAIALSVWGIAARLIDVLQNGGIDKISEMLTKITDSVGGIFGQIGAGVGDAVLALLSSLVESLGGFVSSFVGGIPRVFVFLLVSVISSIFFSLDLDAVVGFFHRIMPKNAAKLLSRLKSSFFSTLVKYLRSYLALMLLTFAVMLTGLLILGRREVFLLALVIALLDVLPVLGVGVVLLPWSFYCFIVGQYGLGIGLLVLYLVHTVIRQLAEPKILGKSLGVHPIVTLVLLYVGYCLFGIFGILLVPIFTVLIFERYEYHGTLEYDE